MGCSHPKYQNLTHNPWFMVCVDLLGSFTIRKPAKTHSLLAIKMIDTVSGWFVIVEATNKSATSIQDLFLNLLHYTWLARHPRLQFIVFENDKEASSKVSSNKYVKWITMELKQKPTTSHNH
jgi:hypothetical protein